MLLERQTELAAIEAGLAQAVAGHGRVVLVVGGPGIGKTTLLDAGAERAGQRGVRVVRARASELEQAVGFGLARRLFGPALRELTAAELDSMMSGAATHARALMGVATEHSAGADEYGAMLGLEWLATNLTDRGPMLMGVDDLHWADRETGRWLAWFADAIGDLPILALVAARSAEPGEDEVVDALIGGGRATVLQPALLSQEAVSEVVRNQFGRAGDTGFVEACWSATGGNPFFVHELLNAVVADEIEPVSAEAHRVLHTGPTEVGRAILLRLGRLNEPARRLAIAVAVLGAEAEIRHAAAVSDLSGSEAFEAWDMLARAQVLRDRQPLEFIHPIARTAVYGELAAGQRSREHRRAAAVLAGDEAAPDQVAVHAAACEPAGDAQVVGWLRMAADAHRASGAPDAAARLLRRALAEPPVPELRSRVRFELGCSLIGVDYVAAVDALAEVPPGPDAGAALGLRGRALAYAGRLAEADSAFGQALDLACDAEERLQIQGTRDFYALYGAAGGDRSGLEQRLLESADGLRGETPGERRTLAVAAMSIAMSGREPAERSSELCMRARGRLSTWLDRDGGSETANAIGTASIVGDEPESAERLERAIEEARRRGWSVNVAAGRYEAAMIHLRRGDLRAAEVDARLSWAALSGMLNSAPTLYWWSAAVLTAVFLARGSIDEASELVDATGLGSEPLEVVIYPWPPMLLGELAIAQGRIASGIEILLVAGDWLERRGFTNPAYAPWRSLAAVALASSGRGDEATSVIQPAIKRARVYGAPWALGMALRAAGTATAGLAGHTMLEEAIAILQAAGCQLELARARLALGSALRRANQRAAAREHLRIALDLARRSGADEIARTARTELEATGARPRNEMLTGVDSLTPTERRVAEMVARGLTNREVAQALFVTRKTVEAHLGHVYRKLDIGSRDRLSMALGS